MKRFGIIFRSFFYQISEENERLIDLFLFENELPGKWAGPAAHADKIKSGMCGSFQILRKAFVNSGRGKNYSSPHR